MISIFSHGARTTFYSTYARSHWLLFFPYFILIRSSAILVSNKKDSDELLMTIEIFSVLFFSDRVQTRCWFQQGYRTTFTIYHKNLWKSKVLKYKPLRSFQAAIISIHWTETWLKLKSSYFNWIQKIHILKTINYCAIRSKRTKSAAVVKSI